MLQCTPIQVSKVPSFEKIRPKLFKTVAYEETSALHVFRLPKLMAHAGVLAQRTEERTGKTLHKLLTAVTAGKAMNRERLNLVISLCKAELSN